MSTGAPTTRTSAIQRSTPRLARNQYAPARTAHTPITLSATSARLRHPATAITSATAASIRANEARASQRRVVAFIRCHPANNWARAASHETTPSLRQPGTFYEWQTVTQLPPHKAQRPGGRRGRRKPGGCPAVTGAGGSPGLRAEVAV